MSVLTIRIGSCILPDKVTVLYRMNHPAPVIFLTCHENSIYVPFWQEGSTHAGIRCHYCIKIIRNFNGIIIAYK
jgi:hypothetical protein